MSSLEGNLPDNYREQLQQIKKCVSKKTDEIIQRFPNFPLHDMQHFDCVATNLGRICAPLNLDPRSRFCLLGASYCHDLGMANTKSSQKLYWLNRSKARRKHAKFSAEAVMNDLPWDCVKEEILRWAIARICEGHGRQDWTHSDFNSVDGINLGLLAALLTVADALDLRNERRNPKNIDHPDQLMRYPFLGEDASHAPDIRKHPELADLSRLHWLRHYYSILPSIDTIRPRSHTVQIKFLASIAIERDNNDNPKLDGEGNEILDNRLPVIEEIIQSDLLEIIDNPHFNKVTVGYLNLELVKPDPNRHSFFNIMPDYTKMAFPPQLVKTAFSGGLIRPLSISLEKAEAYYNTRIEPFLCQDDFQVSVSWRPASLSPHKLIEKIYVPDHIEHIRIVKDLAKEHWDFVLWLVETYVRYLDEELVRKNNALEARERLKALLVAPGIIRSGKLCRVFIAEDGIHTPVTATPHIAKLGVYSGTYPTIETFQGGRIERYNNEQLTTFKRLAKHVADKLEISCSDNDLSSKLLEKCNPLDGYKQSLKTILHIYEALSAKTKDSKVPADFKEFLFNSTGILNTKVITETRWEKNRRLERDLYPRFEVMIESDLEKVMDIEKESYTYFWKNRERFSEYAEQQRGFTLHLNDQVIGYLLIDIYEDVVMIIKMSIACKYRRAGYGRFIVEWVRELTSQRRATRIILHVRESNRGAIQFYERMGFKIFNKIEGYYQRTGQETALEMELSCLK